MCQHAFYPILIREFFKLHIEASLYVPFLESIEAFHEEGPVSKKEIYFSLAAFILPKNAINAVGFNKKEAVKRMKTHEKGI